MEILETIDVAAFQTQSAKPYPCSEDHSVVVLLMPGRTVLAVSGTAANLERYLRPGIDIRLNELDRYEDLGVERNVDIVELAGRGSSHRIGLGTALGVKTFDVEAGYPGSIANVHAGRKAGPLVEIAGQQALVGDVPERHTALDAGLSLSEQTGRKREHEQREERGPAEVHTMSWMGSE